MRSLPEHVPADLIATVVGDGWSLRLGDLRFLPEGGGAYHWLARDEAGQRWFVTVDDLDTKPWLGGDRDAVFEGLAAVYAVAMELRAGGATFVVAPTPTTTPRKALAGLAAIFSRREPAPYDRS